MSSLSLHALALSSSSSDDLEGANADSSSPRTPHELLFANRTVSFVVLLACFAWALLATIAPTLCMRQEHFTRGQILALSIWHAFAAGVLLAAAWLLFLPNMLAVSGAMRLAVPALPFILLFMALLVPLALDRLMLWLSMTRDRPAGGGDKAEETWAATPMAGDRSTSAAPSQPSTPRRTPMQPTSSAAIATASRKGSSVVGASPYSGPGGLLSSSYQSESSLLTESERKIPTHGRNTTHSRSSSIMQGSLRRGGPGGGGEFDPETQPLTGNDVETGLTPKGTPMGPVRSGGGGGDPSATPRGSGWYGSASRSVDASAFKASQPYIARCALCKENIVNAKGLAFHSAGCPLQSFHAFSFSSRWMQGVRGKRSLQRDLIMHEEATAGGVGGGAGAAAAQLGGPSKAVGWSLLCYVVVLSSYNLFLAGSVNLQEAARLYSHAHATSALSSAHASWVGEIGRVALVALVIFCFTGFYGFSLGMMLALHRVSLFSFRAIIAISCYALSLPGSIVLNYALASLLGSESRVYGYYLLVCQCFCVGVVLYAAFLDLMLEEWARKENLWGKNIGFAVGAGIVIATAVWAPL